MGVRWVLRWCTYCHKMPQFGKIDKATAMSGVKLKRKAGIAALVPILSNEISFNL